jgi:hypothetical protein
MYPEPRPIGEIMAMAQISDFDEINVSNMISRTAE